MAKTTAKKNPSKETWIVVDEFGDVAKDHVSKTKVRSRTYGLGISVVDDKDNFIKVSQNIKKEMGVKDELKGRKVKGVHKEQAVRQIHDIGTKTYGFYIDKDKKDNPVYWGTKDRQYPALITLQQSLRKVIDKKKMGNVHVVVDKSELYRDKTYMKNGKPVKNQKLGEFAVKTVLQEKGISNDPVFHSSRKNDECGKMIQSNDIVTNSIKEHVESGNKTYSRILHAKVKRIKR